MAVFVRSSGVAVEWRHNYIYMSSPGRYQVLHVCAYRVRVRTAYMCDFVRAHVCLYLGFSTVHKTWQVMIYDQCDG